VYKRQDFRFYGLFEVFIQSHDVHTGIMRMGQAVVNQHRWEDRAKEGKGQEGTPPDQSST
jgi:hypothetical protein